MNMKNIFTYLLLLFVAAGIVVLAAKSLRRSPQSAMADSALAVKDGVAVYYFHSNTRCPTCQNIEAYAREAVESGFVDELKSKQVVWQVINYEAPGNEHFAKDYEVAAPIVVLAMYKDGKQVKWKGLPEVWEHVGDKPTFVDFVQKSLHEFLEKPETILSSTQPGNST